VVIGTASGTLNDGGRGSVTVGQTHLAGDIPLLNPLGITVYRDGTLAFAQSHGFSGQVNASSGVALGAIADQGMVTTTSASSGVINCSLPIVCSTGGALSLLGGALNITSVRDTTSEVSVLNSGGTITIAIGVNLGCYGGAGVFAQTDGSV